MSNFARLAASTALSFCTRSSSSMTSCWYSLAASGSWTGSCEAGVGMGARRERTGESDLAPNGVGSEDSAMPRLLSSGRVASVSAWRAFAVAGIAYTVTTGGGLLAEVAKDVSRSGFDALSLRRRDRRPGLGRAEGGLASCCLGMPGDGLALDARLGTSASKLLPALGGSSDLDSQQFKAQCAGCSVWCVIFPCASWITLGFTAKMAGSTRRARSGRMLFICSRCRMRSA